MANALDKARQALTSARDKITEWERAIDTARADRERAEQVAPADAADLDEYADTYARAEGRIRAARAGVKAAEAAALVALEDVVRAGLDDARADARAKAQEHDAHRRKVDVLLEKLTRLDGADYQPVTVDTVPRNPGESVTVRNSHAAALSGEAYRADQLVKRLEYVLEHHEQPTAFIEGPCPDYAVDFINAAKAAGVTSPARAAADADAEVDRLEAEQAAAARAEVSTRWHQRSRLSGPKSTGVLPG